MSEKVVENDEKTPTQYRVERAERQTEERILNELGVKTLDELKEQLEQAKKTEEVLNETHKELETVSRRERLVALLQKEDAFDPDVLLPFVNVDELESDEDFGEVVNKLKELKPNHFGVKSIQGDTHKESTKTDKNPIRTKELQGDYRGAIAEHIRQLRKG